MFNFFQKASKYLRNIIALNTDDIFLVSFPKSGNTWVRFYLCNLINNIPEYHFTDSGVDFKTLDTIMPELGKSNLTKPWPFKGFPRIIKTHLGYKPFFSKCRSVLVVRDPRDVMVSYFKFEITKSETKFAGNNISKFIRHPKMGIESWCRHYLSWKRKTGIIIKYEDLKCRDEEIFRNMNDFLGIKVRDEIFLNAVEQSRFENIKKMESLKGLADPSKGSTEFKFARSGKTGQWKEMFSEDDLTYIKNTLQRFSICLYGEVFHD